MKIIRAGMTGCIAAIMNPGATIFHQGEITQHKAVLRFRSPRVSEITGIPFKEVQVHKGIFSTSEGCFVPPSIISSNLYSQKVIGGLYDRSIESLDTVTRWVAPDDFHPRLLDILDSSIIDEDIDLGEWQMEPVISTLPMFELAKLLDTEVSCDQSFKSIKVTRGKVPGCEVHQTVYFPEFDTPIYRVSLEGENLIIESVDDIDSDAISMVVSVFGLLDSIGILEMNYEQKIGKMKPMDEEERKQFIWNATHHHNIYALGRTAVWRQILLDDCVQDVTRIQSMIAKSNYDRMLGK